MKTCFDCTISCCSRRFFLPFVHFERKVSIFVICLVQGVFFCFFFCSRRLFLLVIFEHCRKANNTIKIQKRIFLLLIFLFDESIWDSWEGGRESVGSGGWAVFRQRGGSGFDVYAISTMNYSFAFTRTVALFLLFGV